MTWRICKQCGIDYEGPRYKYCGDACKRIVARQSVREWRVRHPEARQARAAGHSQREAMARAFKRHGLIK